MAPEVLKRKLTVLRQLIADLGNFRNATPEQVAANHYAVERILELLAMVAIDIVTHLLSEREKVPENYRHAFQLAAEENILPADLAERLQRAAAMRNLLTHVYERIDHDILRRSIEPALADMAEFASVLEASLR